MARHATRIRVRTTVAAVAAAAAACLATVADSVPVVAEARIARADSAPVYAEAAQLARAPAPRRLPATLQNVVIPPRGSYGDIYGNVVGLGPNATDFKVCVYERGVANTYFGPKPFEDLGTSSTPVNADGSFRYHDWYANYIFDPTSVEMHLFVWANADGNCLSVIGGPASECRVRRAVRAHCPSMCSHAHCIRQSA